MPTLIIYGLCAVTLTLGVACVVPSPYQGLFGLGASLGGAACAYLAGWLGRWLASVAVLASVVLLAGCGQSAHPISGPINKQGPPKGGNNSGTVISPVRPGAPGAPGTPGNPPPTDNGSGGSGTGSNVTPFASLEDAAKQASIPGSVIPLTDDVVTVTIKVLGDPEWFTLTDWSAHIFTGYVTSPNKPYVEVLYTSTTGDRRLVAFEAFPGAVHARLVPGFYEVLPIERLKAGYTIETLGNACVSMTNIIGDYEGWSFTRHYGIINEDGHILSDDDPAFVSVDSQGVLWVPPTRTTPMTVTAREGNFTPWNLPEGNG